MPPGGGRARSRTDHGQGALLQPEHPGRHPLHVGGGHRLHPRVVVLEVVQPQPVGGVQRQQRGPGGVALQPDLVRADQVLAGPGPAPQASPGCRTIRRSSTSIAASAASFLSGLVPMYDGEVAGVDALHRHEGHAVGHAPLVAQLDEEPPALPGEHGGEHLQRVAIGVAHRQRPGSRAPGASVPGRASDGRAAARWARASRGDARRRRRGSAGVSEARPGQRQHLVGVHVADHASTSCDGSRKRRW